MLGVDAKKSISEGSLLVLTSSYCVDAQVEGIVVKIYVNAIKKARVKDAKKIAAFREQLRIDGKDESTLLSRSEEEVGGHAMCHCRP